MRFSALQPFTMGPRGIGGCSFQLEQLLEFEEFMRALRTCACRGLLAFAAVFAGLGSSTAPAAGQDISAFDQHFNEPGKDIAPWMFVPRENIKQFSTAEHPGLATIFEAGAGADIKGILKDPIKIGDYQLPWEFQTSLVQSFNLTGRRRRQDASQLGHRPECRPHVLRSRHVAQATAANGRHKPMSFNCWSCTWAARARRAPACRNTPASRIPKRISSGAVAIWATRRWATGGFLMSGSATGRSTPGLPARNSIFGWCC